MAYDPTIAPQYIGGGGGWGFGGGGFGGAFGGGFLGSILGEAFEGRRGRGGEGIHGTEIILDDNHYNSLTNNIGQVKAEVGAKAEAAATRFNAFELAWCQANGATNMAIANGTFQGALNTKDIIHDLDTKICMTNRNIDQVKFELSKQMSDCCCKQEMLTLTSTQKILDRLCEDEKAELRDRLNRVERDNDLFRLSTSIRTAAATNGSNFNTGTQSASNNSGQING